MAPTPMRLHFSLCEAATERIDLPTLPPLAANPHPFDYGLGPNVGDIWASCSSWTIIDYKSTHSAKLSYLARMTHRCLELARLERPLGQSHSKDVF